VNAVQENLLPASTPQERFALARALGYNAVEVWASDITDDTLLDYAQAVDASGLPISALYMGDEHAILAADPAQRDAAVDRVRVALTNAHDLRVPCVVVVPQPAAARDVISGERAYDMMIGFVRVVNDLAGAMDTALCLLPLAPAQALALNTLGQGMAALRTMNMHPAVALAADMYSLHSQGESVESLCQDMGMLPMIRQIYVHHPAKRALEADEALLNSLRGLREAGYSGGFTAACGLPATTRCAPATTQALQAFLEALQDA
jgi:sugar phosphate isomerase/epimerase